MPEAVSLSYELAEILDALCGVRALIEPLQEPVEPRERVQAIASTISVLTMTAIRLRHVVEVVRGDQDPVKILERHNLIPAGFHLECPDVLLKPWKTERVAAHARTTLEMLERAAARAKRNDAQRRRRSRH